MQRWRKLLDSLKIEGALFNCRLENKEIKFGIEYGETNIIFNFFFLTRYLTLFLILNYLHASKFLKVRLILS